MNHLHRTHDPHTSVTAASRCKSFAPGHCEQILSVLQTLGGGDMMGADSLSRATGLTVEQCARRLPELERNNLARVCVDESGEDMTHNGYRLWEAVTLNDGTAPRKRKIERIYFDGLRFHP